jgi:hypothetical protein
MSAGINPVAASPNRNDFLFMTSLSDISGNRNNQDAIMFGRNRKGIHKKTIHIPCGLILHTGTDGILVAIF